MAFMEFFFIDKLFEILSAAFILKTTINVYMGIFSYEGRILPDSQISLYWIFF